MTKNISAVILTFNEDMHIKRCVDSLLEVVDHIYVMDSFSTDSTLIILSEYKNITIKKNKFINYAVQFNHALDEFNIDSDWVMRIDADEYIDSELVNYLNMNIASIPSATTGILLNRHMTFMGKFLIHGGMSSYWMLRLWRNGMGRCEQTWMDEHIILSSGDMLKADGKLVDDNLNTLSWWAHKHVDYSTREAIDIIQRELNQQNNTIEAKLFGSKSEQIRFLKNLYSKMPLFVRPFIYFIYRYFIRFGFLDGKQGFLWCVFQGFWYRMMVDAKVFELKSLVHTNLDIKAVIKLKYGYEI
ncbi:MAG: glycosyltransferase involved in cell wall biosynthesis [Oceanospirillaceae bacterium]|jgi:glycosyltransferase involved in cell wall biosynthesis